MTSPVAIDLPAPSSLEYRRGQRLHEALLAESRAAVEHIHWDAEPERVPLRVVR